LSGSSLVDGFATETVPQQGGVFDYTLSTSN